MKLYDKVLLKTGEVDYIVHICKVDSDYIVDIDRDGETYTEPIKMSEIEKVLD